MKDEARIAYCLGVVAGMLLMGLAMEYIGPNSRAKVDSIKAECELNIPRNQSCVMQFVPEK